MTLRQAFRAGSSRDGRPGWALSFDFDQALIDGIKAWIPAADREWNPERRLWWVASLHEERLAALLPGFEAFLKQPQLF